MTYVLAKPLEKKLTKLIPSVDKNVVRIFAGIAPSSAGDDWLFFRVVLKDDPSLLKVSNAVGERLARIASALRQRAANLDVPMFASVRFMAESELPRSKRHVA